MILSAVRAAVGVLIGAVIAFPGHAQQDPSPSLLTPGIVENFIASYPKVKAKVDELRAQDQVAGDLSGAPAWRTWAGVDGAKFQLDAVVQAHGFPDFPTWVRVLSVTAQTYAFAQVGTDLDGKMAEALARIENDPNITESRKEMMRQQIRHAAHAMEAMTPSQASVDAVTPYAKQLGQLFDEK